MTLDSGTDLYRALGALPAKQIDIVVLAGSAAADGVIDRWADTAPNWSARSGRCTTSRPPVATETRDALGVARDTCWSLEDGLSKLCREEAAVLAAGATETPVCSGRDGHVPAAGNPCRAAA
jgi:hypothetical protein